MLVVSIGFYIATTWHVEPTASVPETFVSWDLRESVPLSVNSSGAADGRPYETAKLVKDAILRSDFDTAEKAASEILKLGHLPIPSISLVSEFYGALSVLSDDGFPARLDEWVAKKPSSMVAYSIRAQFYHDLGWHRRGHGYINTVDDDGIRAFGEAMRTAEADVNRALELDPSEPFLQYLRLEILRGYGYSDKMGSALQDSISKFPTFFAPYELVLASLQPKWGGSVDISFRFVDHFHSTDPDSVAAKLLDIAVYRQLLEIGSSACSESEKSDYQKISDCVRDFMKENSTSAREGRLVAALTDLGKKNDYAANKIVEHQISAMIDLAGSEIYVGPVLQAAANAYESDTRMTEASNTHNHYMIDSLVAKTWLRQGNFDNALAKYREALRDIANAKFPSRQDQDVATAEILEQVATVYAKESRYADSAKTAREAVSSGGGADAQLWVCYNDHWLDNFRAAVDECADILDDQNVGLDARYWRGASYLEMHDNENAFRELQLVADSASNWKVTAAMDLSRIYFDRKDNVAALGVLNKYTYLYDLQSSNKDDVAIAFNNRCYAYMELGQYKEALADCTNSLANGSIPDAYKKQQDLLKLIAAQ
jgi:tetratricopeptide (TPR) repeat protein